MRPLRPSAAIAAAILAACIAPSRRAYADQAQWIPVLVEESSSERTLELVNGIATALRTKENVALLDPVLAARRFESQQSAEPVEVPDDELRALGDSFRKALEAAALGQWDKASELVRKFDELSQPMQDYVNWRLNLSRDIFDYCLMSVHFMLADGREGAARDEMRNCIYSAPDRKLGAKDTPEQVIQLHESVKAELLSQGEASLDVDANGPPGTASGCVAVVNGAPKGALPYREKGLLPVPVRIQVNCQRPGRIHVVRLKPGRNALIVDLRLERIVRTQGYLGLRYGDAREEQSSQVRDGLTLAKALGGSDLLLVRRTSSGRVALRRIDVQLEKLVAEVTLASNANADEIQAAAHALAVSRSGDVSASTENASPPRVTPRADGRNLYAGTAIAAGSVASFAIAWFSYARSIDYRNGVERGNRCVDAKGTVDTICIENFAYQQSFGDFTLVFGGLGAALGAASAPALLPQTKGVPWWSWAAGAGGAGVAAVGAVLWANGSSCSLNHCEEGLSPRLGELLVLHSPPLLAIPITHLIRSLLKSERVQASAEYSRAGARFTVVGNF